MKEREQNSEVITAEVTQAVNTLISVAPLQTADQCEQASSALKLIQGHVRDSTATMSSVPLPMKVMRGRYDEIVEAYDLAGDASEAALQTKRLYADLISLLATTMASKMPSLSITETVEPVVSRLNDSGIGQAQDKENVVEVKDIVSIHDAVDEAVAEAAKEDADNGQIPAALQYRMKGSGVNGLLDYGPEYVRSLVPHIIRTYVSHVSLGVDDSEEIVETCKLYTRTIARHLLQNNSWLEAVDLLAEIDMISELEVLVRDLSEDTAPRLRVAEYLQSAAMYERSEEAAIQNSQTAYTLLVEAGLLVEAADLLYSQHSRGLMELERVEVLLRELWSHPKMNRSTRRQIAFNLVNCGLHALLNEKDTQQELLKGDDKEVLEKILHNSLRKDHFAHLIKELDLGEPRHPDDIYKTYLDNTDCYCSTLESSAKNRVNTYVSAFINCGFKKDSIMSEASRGDWVDKNKCEGQSAAIAGLAALHMWDMERALCAVDKYSYASDVYKRAGAYIGYGLACSQQLNHLGVPFTLVQEGLCSTSNFIRRSALIGFSLCATSYPPDSKDLPDVVRDLEDLIENVGGEVSGESVSVAALTLGLIGLGQRQDYFVETITRMWSKQQASDSTFGKNYHSIFLSVGLGFSIMGKGAEVEKLIEEFSGFTPGPLRRYNRVLIKAMAYTGTQNMEVMQWFIRVFSDGADVDDSDDDTEVAKVEPDDRPKDELNKHLDRRLAVVGIALVSLGDPIGREMLLKFVESLMQHGDVELIRAIPLALAVAHASNPINKVMDYLTRLSYEQDSQVALSAIVAYGIVAAGTNNARAARALRQLAQYYQKSESAMFCIRFSQGLVHMGKGTLTISPLMHRGRVINFPGLAHLLVVVMMSMNVEKHLLQDHLMLWHLAAAARPKVVNLLQADTLEPCNASLRVGTAVNTVGMAGKPRSVTGFQTHASPVILSEGEQVELDTALDEEHIVVPITTMLEGAILVNAKTCT